MEIIFTLILLIGFGINSHRYEVQKKETPKQIITSTIQQEIDQNEIGRQLVKRNGKADINTLPEISDTEAVKSNSAKGKYISFRLNDGNG
jgi:hypothetical protein